MCWRTESYAAWLKIKGAGAKEAFKNLVQKGKAHGILAFSGRTHWVVLIWSAEEFSRFAEEQGIRAG
jgi:hypothetical protein